MANIKQEEEGLSDVCSLSLVQFDIPKHELIDIKVEPQGISEMRSEFDLPSSMDRTSQAIESIDLPSSIASGGKNNMCSLCNTIFASSHSLTTHLLAHTGEKPFVCSFCSKEFRRKGTLKVHQRIHTGEKPYMCKWCEKKFVDSSTFAKHKRIHTGEKPYTCGWCDKGFAGSYDRTTHERTHTGEKPYPCKMCTSRFRQSGDLRRHERKMHFDFEFEKYGETKK